MTVNFENYLDSFKMNRHAKHQGQRSFTSKLLSIHTDRQTDTHTHTHTHTHTSALPGLLKWSVDTSAQLNRRNAALVFRFSLEVFAYRFS